MTFPRIVLLATLACSVAAGSLEASRAVGAPGQAAVALQIVRDGESISATCVLVHREQRFDNVVLHFVTAGHLFKSADGTPLPRARKIEVLVDAATTIAVDPKDVDFPAGSAADIALIRATVPASALAALPIVYEAPPSGGVFLIAGRTTSGGTNTVAQRVSRRTPLTVVGDRDTSPLAGCAGAPAISERGMFGVVSNCSTDGPPVIAPLSAVRSWLEAQLPGLMPAAPFTTQFSVSPRDFAGPLILASCGEDHTGNIDVPLSLAAGEMAVDASATFTNRKAIRLADVKVLTLTNETVTLRFSIGGEPPPRPPAPCPPGQALVTVHMTVVKTPR